MIELINVNKFFNTQNGSVQAVKDVNLKVKSGEIYGIIGHSGAGKSTLVRCINLLERPDSGEVSIANEDILLLNENELRYRRHKIGMIFQQFNLLSARTVFENVAFPLRFRGISRKEIREKVVSLLELVGLSDKEKAYPSELSGGQKQRVAIARALANDPEILLCDEATSALDPQTTNSILDLLKDLNRKLQLTVVIITHEMHVVKKICDRVAVMENGAIVEQDTVLNVFVRPQHQTTKEFINTVNNFEKIDELIQADSDIVNLQGNQKLLRLDFHGENTQEAIISEVSQKFGVQASIIFANVDIVQDTVVGSLIVVLSGSEDKQQEAIEFLEANDIRLEDLKDARNLSALGA